MLGQELFNALMSDITKIALATFALGFVVGALVTASAFWLF